jgi:hypothetical protein
VGYPTSTPELASMARPLGFSKELGKKGKFFTILCFFRSGLFRG